MKRGFLLQPGWRAWPGYAHGFASPSFSARFQVLEMGGDWVRPLAQALEETCEAALKREVTFAPSQADPLQTVFYCYCRILAALGWPVRQAPQSIPQGAVFPTFFHHPAVPESLRWLLMLINQIVAQDNFAPCLLQLQQRIRQLDGVLPKQQSVIHFFNAAQALDIPVVPLPGRIFQYGQGSRSRRLQATYTDETPCVASNLANDKIWAASLLRRAGLPVSPHILVQSVGEAQQAAQQLGYPVVVKPANLHQGIGVYPGLTTPEEVQTAFEKTAKLSNIILLEKHFQGRDYRLTVFRGEVIWATERVPGGVVGDGVTSVAQLLAKLNLDPLRGTDHRTPLRRMALDEEAKNVLQRDGWAEHDVPAEGQFVRLRIAANVNQGGHPQAVFHKLHPDNVWLAVRAVETLGLDLAGVDLLIPDIALSWREQGAVICEVNPQPGLGSVTSTKVYSDILRTLVTGNGRIPVLALVGIASDSPLAADICQGLHDKGLRVGWADGTLVVASGVSLSVAPVNLYNGGTMLLMDRKIDALVLFVQDHAILHTGFPCDRLDCLVVRETSPLVEEMRKTCSGRTFQLSETAPPREYTWLDQARAAQLLVAEMLEADRRHGFR